ncbi:hypothetical protein AURDEDRAFT_186558 [Auricularia subglabra TFB-10046 SS5]|uniref:Uncharacterized protein n=1 Tax=Auricularia subglabra (strain TFB-10046 / SS5) TaxID=717982 RepID=J0LKA5_AURST|nr:hypothetical protein AURDEDRAFT_186558 [Auricularia subglabra TFB-10046 SS5]
MSNATTTPLLPGDIPWERVTMVAGLVGTFFWGVHFVLFLITVYTFYSQRHKRPIPAVPLVYVFLFFLSASAYMFCDLAWGIDELIDHRDYPGGPLQYYFDHFNKPVALAGTAFFTITNFFADSLLLWRTWVVWGCNWYIVAIPILIFLGSTALSMITVYQLATPGARFFSKTLLQFSLPYFSLSIALNFILTIMILTKLFIARRRILKTLDEEQGRIYTGMAAMIVESAALTSTFSILFIVMYSLNNDGFNVCLPLQVQMMCISPLLIMIRVARGHAYSQEAITQAETSKMVFARETGLSKGMSTTNGDSLAMTTLAASAGNNSESKISSIV